MNAFTGSFFLLGTLAFLLVSLVVGFRLVALSRKTGERPERYLGLGILGTAVFGYGAQIASVILRGGPDVVHDVTTVAVALTALGKLLHDLGVTLVLSFVLTVFRAKDAKARMLFGVAVSTLWIGMVGLGITGGYHDLTQQNMFWWMEYAVIWTYPLWGAYEAFRYHGRMQKRVKIGLSDLTRALPFQTFNYLSTAFVGICTVSVYLLAFIPPDWYRRRFAASAGAVAPGTGAAQAL